jgi:hypothetical protein
MLNTYDYNAGLREARREILAITESDPESVKTALFQVLGLLDLLKQEVLDHHRQGHD